MLSNYINLKGGSHSKQEPTYLCLYITDWESGICQNWHTQQVDVPGVIVSKDVCKIIFCPTLLSLRHKNAANVPRQSL